MIFFSICWGQEHSMNLKKSLLLEQLLLLDGPCPLQPRCGHQCNVTLLTFCSISSAITLLGPLGPTEQYVFFLNFGKMLITSFRLLSSRNASVRVSILLAPDATKGEASCWIIVLFWYKKHRKHPRQWLQRRFTDKNLGIFQAFNQVVFTHPQPGYFHALSASGIPPEQRTQHDAVAEED